LVVVVASVIVASAVVVAAVVVLVVVVALVIVASAVIVVVASVVDPSPRESLKIESLKLIILPHEPLPELLSHSFHVSFGLVGQVHLHANVGKKIDVAIDWRIILLHANVGMTFANRHERIVDLRLERIADLRRCIISPPPGEQRGATVETRKLSPNILQSAAFGGVDDEIFHGYGFYLENMVREAV
jgi:hypothetical protein